MVILLWHTRWSAGTWPPCPGWWSPPPCLKSSPMSACFFQGVGLLAGVCRYLEYFFASSWTLYVTLGFIKTHFLERGSNASINFTFFSVYTSLAKRPCWFYLATQIKPVDLPDQRHNEGSGHPPLPQGHTHHSMCWKILFHDSSAQRWVGRPVADTDMGAVTKVPLLAWQVPQHQQGEQQEAQQHLESWNILGEGVTILQRRSTACLEWTWFPDGHDGKNCTEKNV